MGHEMRHPELDLQGKKVLVIGLARTGLATVRFLREKGAKVTVTEMRRREEMAEAAAAIDSLGIEAEWGGHRPETFARQDLVVVSPGVDQEAEPIRSLVAGLRVIGEVELAFRFLSAPLIAVTGTNGKTTTTLLLGEMLKAGGMKAGVGGNVGTPLLLFADGKEAWDAVVAEISSFQLETIETFRPRIAILLNITEDHLDRYPRYEDYIRAKAQVFANQGAEDTAVLNLDDPVVMGLGETIASRKVFFSQERRLDTGTFASEGIITVRLDGGEETYSLAKAPLKGVHNVENMMAAVTAARLAGCPPEAVQAVLDRFEGLEHRVEFVREVAGVRFYNDSKGTNVGSVVKSLQGFTEPVILIAGGKDKQGDLSPLTEGIRSRVKRMILIGEARERMARELGGLTETVMAGTLEQAVRLGFEAAKPGDVVLLSPACSSYDMFRDYKERGKVFKEAVRGLGEGR
jgi:UDP-N-acetylmuramoylalanine--D-glutamate ligase